MGATAVKTAVDLSLVPLGRGEKNDLVSDAIGVGAFGVSRMLDTATESAPASAGKGKRPGILGVASCLALPHSARRFAHRVRCMDSSAEERKVSDPERTVLLIWTTKQMWGSCVIFSELLLVGAVWAMMNVSAWFFPAVAAFAYFTGVGALRWIALQRDYLGAFAEAQHRTGLPLWTRARPRAYLHQRGVRLAPGEVSDPVVKVLARAPALFLFALALVASVVRLVVFLRQ